MQMGDHARIVIRRELVKEVAHIARVAAWPAQRGFGISNLLREQGPIFCPKSTPRIERLFRFSGIEPGRTKTDMRTTQIRIEPQRPLVFADGGGEMAGQPQRLAQPKRGGRRIRIELYGLPRYGQSGRHVARCGERRLPCKAQQQPAAIGIDARGQQRSSLGRATFGNQLLGNEYRIVRK
jgi:hypothetical protein